MFIYLFSLAIAQANQVLVGYFIGEEKNEEVYKQTFKTQGLGRCCFSDTFELLPISVVIYYLFGIFTNDPAILSLGKS